MTTRKDKGGEAVGMTTSGRIETDRIETEN